MCWINQNDVTITGQNLGTCLFVFAQEGDYCGEGAKLDCDVGLECREFFHEGFRFSTYTCKGPEPLGELHDVCLGFNEKTGEPFADCREGLECRPTPGSPYSIPGSGNSCQYPQEY